MIDGTGRWDREMKDAAMEKQLLKLEADVEGRHSGVRWGPSGAHAYVQEMGSRNSSLGPVEYIKVRRTDDRSMSWTEVWATFTDRYPGRWAVQVFPPKDEVVDEANIYHLFILDGEPTGLNINRR